MAIEVEQLRVVIETNARLALRELKELHEQMLRMGKGTHSSPFGTKEQMRIAKEQMLGEVKAANAALRETQVGEARRVQKMTTQIALDGQRAQARGLIEAERASNRGRYQAQQEMARLNREKLKAITDLEAVDYRESQRRITNDMREQSRKQRELAVNDARGRRALALEAARAQRPLEEHSGRRERGGGYVGGGLLGGAVTGAAFGAAYGGYSFAKQSVTGSQDFQADMLRSSSLAGLDKSQIPRYSEAILKLAAQVGENPVKLADALYHQLSVLPEKMTRDQRFKTAIEGVRTSALGAGIGGGDIVQTQLALNAGMAAGGTDQKALMNLALRTVGAGDMTLANYTSALSNGALGVGKAYGAKDGEIGAFLALLGDNNIRGSLAGTQVKMSLQSLTQLSGGNGGKDNEWLAKLGIAGQNKRFSNDLAKGGMTLALEDLHNLLLKSGYTGQSSTDDINSGNFKNHSMGQVITGLFGKRAGIGLTLAEQEYNTGNTNWKDKLKRVGSSDASGFDKDAAAYKGTGEFKAKSMEAAKAAFQVSLGTTLMPLVNKFYDGLVRLFTYLQKHLPDIEAFAKSMWKVVEPIFSWVKAHGKLVATIAAVSLGVSGLMKVFGPLIMLIRTGAGLGPWGIALVAVGTALVWAYNHSETFRKGVQKLWHALVEGFHKVVAGVKKWAHDHKTEIDKIKADLHKLLEAAGKALGSLGKLFSSIFNAIAKYLHEHKKEVDDWSKRLLTALDMLIKGLTWIVTQTDHALQGWAAIWDKYGQIIIGVIRVFKDILTLDMGDIAKMASGWGKSIIDGLVNGIKGAAGSLKDAVKTGIVDLLPGPVQSALGIKSPSRVFHNIGNNVIAGLVGGITGGRPLVGATMKDLSDMVALRTGAASATSIGGRGAGHLGGGHSSTVSLHVDHLHLGTAGNESEARALGNSAADALLQRLAQQTVGKTTSRRTR